VGGWMDGGYEEVRLLAHRAAKRGTGLAAEGGSAGQGKVSSYDRAAIAV